MKLAFFTGARSEYGILKKLIREISTDEFFEVSIIVGGMHLLKNFGYTITEIENDNFKISARIPIFEESIAPDYTHFIKAIKSISNHFHQNSYDAIFIVGDRFEAYAAALAAHFEKIPIIHSGGGTITLGATDNIYRYNISNLSLYHFATSKGNYERLLTLPILKKENIYFSGSVAIDSIKAFLKKPNISIRKKYTNIVHGKYVLVSFHPTTNKKENIAQILKESVEFILKNNFQVLITYPNNDLGSRQIIEVINILIHKQNVFVSENLGADLYYSALMDCAFVIGNSSSGIVEAPYFKKKVLNIGSRQEGREKDVNIIDVEANTRKVIEILDFLFHNGYLETKCNEIYGNGSSIKYVKQIIKDNFSSN